MFEFTAFHFSDVCFLLLLVVALALLVLLVFIQKTLRRLYDLIASDPTTFQTLLDSYNAHYVSPLWEQYDRIRNRNITL